MLLKLKKTGEVFNMNAVIGFSPGAGGYPSNSSVVRFTNGTNRYVQEGIDSIMEAAREQGFVPESGSKITPKPSGP